MNPHLKRCGFFILCLSIGPNTEIEYDNEEIIQS
jgi:hypothetical protein